MATPMRAATGIPTPRPTPRAVVLDFFAGSASLEGVEVDAEPALEADDAVEAAAVDAPADADAGAPDVATEAEVEEAEELVDVCVCVNDSPMMVRVYTSAGDCAKVNISDPEFAWQSQPS